MSAKFVFTIFFSLLFLKLSHAEEGSKSAHVVGVQLAYNSAPHTSAASARLAIQPVSFLRFSGGTGMRIIDTSVGENLYNFTVGWLLDTIFGTVVRSMGAKDFSLLMKPKAPKEIYSKAFSLYALVPGLPIKPFAGVHYNFIDALNSTYGLPRTSRHTTYSAGVDYVANNGFNLGVEYGWATTIEAQKNQLGFYLGYFF